MVGYKMVKPFSESEYKNKDFSGEIVAECFDHVIEEEWVPSKKVYSEPETITAKEVKQKRISQFNHRRKTHEYQEMRNIFAEEALEMKSYGRIAYDGIRAEVKRTRRAKKIESLLL